MTLYLRGHSFRYETENLCRAFFQNETINVVSSDSSAVENEEIYVITEITASNGGVSLNVDACVRGAQKSVSASLTEGIDDFDSERERCLQVLLYKALSSLTGEIPPWGILTGVRPSKLMSSKLDIMSENEALRYFTHTLLVAPSKAQLALNVSKCESTVISSSRPDSFSLYISIPFCPSRCSYCSFVSHSITAPGAKKLVPDYVRLLCEEIAFTGKIASDLALRLESVYFGGGTPTVLSADELDIILKTVKNNFNLFSCREYTVEAGRPDTVTEEKLRVLKANGVDRISINPQTLNDNVLINIGRKHTANEAIEKYQLARSLGFDNINMDLIAGLSGDTPESFNQTIRKIIELSPENITVHSLAMKRSSTLVSEDRASAADGKAAAKMLNFVESSLPGSGYHPYYMYRQSRSAGNLENVGWCRQGRECIYNIFMMEECHTVLACGAGAVTKLRSPKTGFIERIFNFKYPYEYISRFDELTDRKKRIKEFYNA